MTRLLDMCPSPPGDTVTISCTASQSVSHPSVNYDTLNRDQKKPGKSLKRIIRNVSERPSGFEGSGDTTKFTLTIKGTTEEDPADYYCQQRRSRPLTQ
ncbi:hypothetical protein GDO81_000030 [Engystomops pustulosus]|uniref:Ig-like domain-containing protein n=1 Tax=Engystomops pustulosus TaxID=76066 RepID=A0AAV7D2Y1_ENGPU|nr:hypothetical protein GDO81_000030 [Engystomops pustulosus]